MKTVDVGHVLDEGAWSGYQKLLIFFAALTIIFDGADNQLLSVAIPRLTEEWGLARKDFSPVAAAGLVGMMLGGAIGGVLGDRIGRRKPLIASVFIFATMTLLISQVHDLWMMGFLRFLAGLGLGGAMPNGTALASEYVPRRHRAFAVTLTLVCIPVGGTIAGLVGGEVLPDLGWRWLFAIGGMMPLVLGCLLIFTLPESPRFLARRRERWGELRQLLARTGNAVPADTEFVDRVETSPAASGPRKSSVQEVLAPAFRWDTIALSASFFFCLMAAYSGVLWLPSMLSGANFDVVVSSHGLTAFNVGGVIGALIAAPLVSRFGSRPTMLVMCAGAVAGATVIVLTPLREQPLPVIFALLAWSGGLINATQTIMYALASHVYPAAVRATGVGTAVSVGRIGAIVSATAGQLSSLTQLFQALAVLMSVVFVALAAVRHHIPRRAAATSGSAEVAGR